MGGGGVEMQSIFPEKKIRAALETSTVSHNKTGPCSFKKKEHYELSKQ